MSRIIVKNLPKKISPERIKAIFSSQGEVTDIQLKFTKDGKFRQFAFIGFKDEEQAQAAINFFHNTYVDSSKVKVEACENLGSEKVKPWSKHSKVPIVEENKKNSEKMKLMLSEDPKLAEFLSIRKKAEKACIWSSDGFPEMKEGSLGSEVVKIEKGNTQSENLTKEKPCKKPNFDDSCTVKIRDLPFKCKKKQIKLFFAPLKITSLRIPPRLKGLAYVKFETDKDMKKALNKHRGFLEGHRVSVLKHICREAKTEEENQLSPGDQDIDPLIESGRIFVRNLCYSTTVEDLEKHFQTFGKVTEVHLPYDQFTQKIKGFAFVTFMFPEHAVKALSQLDGSSFQGRTLHLLPAKAKKMTEEPDTAESSFRKKKESQVKAQSGSWHNWNTLFLGANAVADVMAQKYNTSKAKLLNTDSKSSVAVTMALGETQIVSETKEFLVNHGVSLDAFQNSKTERSKTTILVKNLPANTKEKQIRDVFSLHGKIERLVLPPSGVTAIVEFHHPTEAKLAFRKLAYSKFQYTPLYLEWAPANALGDTLKKSETNVEGKQPEAGIKDVEGEENKCDKHEPGREEENDVEIESGTILFVKNLNFETRENNLLKHFEKCGKLASVTVAMKGDPKNPGNRLSMGYGFVQFKKKKSASKALKELQHSSLDGHTLELKMSTRDTVGDQPSHRKVTKVGEQKSTKILVRNIPFEATKKEIREIFSVFGELRALRLPQKVSGEHRGFGFVDFLTRHDAQRAMTSLGASTHVFGRRLVLEWAEADDTADEVDVLRQKTAKRYQTTHQHGAGRKKLKDSLDPADLSS